ncbi:CLUMA_CG013144, isoform A [Clunio marinus]|uniref:CLUMA_CG013144, isoform A n=1 Tax=Clunio marinus TaxID=568069 RepID=A0A1J1IMZ1_9DIPT|nr:CLUMA_CG013144, isoform A [Clunio marinus]
MKFKFEIIFISTLFHLSTSINYENYKVVSFEVVNETQLKEIKTLESENGFIFWDPPQSVNNKLDLVIRPDLFPMFEEIASSNGIQFKVTTDNLKQWIDAENPPKLRKEGFSLDQYNQLEDIYAFMDEMENNHPEASVFTIGESFEGRPIKGIKITNNENNPGIFIESTIHAREWIATATSVWLINEILTSEDINLREITDSLTWYFVPVVNVDGYQYTHDVNRLWRKTRSMHNILCRGVDPNRNFGFNFREGGSSNVACSDTYSGPYAFSEKETRALMDFYETIADKTEAYICFHSAAQALMYPLGTTNSTESVPNRDDLHNIAQTAVYALTSTFGTVYRYGNAMDTLYMTSGTSRDHAYGHYKTPLVFTYEMRTADDINSVISETSSGEVQVEMCGRYRKIISLICLMLIAFGAKSVNGNETITCGKDIWSREFTCYIDEAIHEKGRKLSGRIDLQTTSFYINKNKTVKYLPENASAVFPNLERYQAKRCSILEVHYSNFIGLPKLQMLDLSGNQIEILQDDVFKDLTSLELLQLSYNKIENINERNFNGLGNLELLELGHNQLQILNNDTFRQLSSLYHLRLTKNSIKHIEENSFNGLGKLTTLHLDHNQLDKLDFDIFAPLSSLQYLNLVQNNIKHIDGNVSQKLEKLEELNLNYNQLDKLDNEVFAPLSSLTQLDLMHNNLKEIDKSAFNGLKMLKTLMLDHNQLQKLDNELFATLPSLENLMIGFNYISTENNRIKEIDANVFKGLSKLSELNLNCNQFEKLENDMFAPLSSLSHLRLNNNSIKQIEENTFNGLGKLTFLELDRNQLDKIERHVFLPLSSLSGLSLAYNKINQFDENAFNGLNNLEFLILNHNKLERLDYALIEPLISLRELTLQNNSIKFIDESIFTEAELFFPDLRMVDLSSNFCINKEISMDEIEIKKVLSTIRRKCQQKEDLKKDQVKECQFNIDEFKEEMRQQFTEIKDIKQQLLKFENEIKSQYSDIKTKLNELTVLDLNHNKLERLDYALIEPLISLRELTLQNNSIKFIDELIFTEAELFIPDLRMVDLSSNSCINKNIPMNNIEIKKALSIVKRKCQHKEDLKKDQVKECQFNRDEFKEEMRQQFSEFKEIMKEFSEFKKEIKLQLSDIKTKLNDLTGSH